MIELSAADRDEIFYYSKSKGGQLLRRLLVEFARGLENNILNKIRSGKLSREQTDVRYVIAQTEGKLEVIQTILNLLAEIEREKDNG